MEEMKTCSRCKEDYPLYAFYKDKNYNGGYKSHCKDCEKAYYKRRYSDPNSKSIETYFKPTKEDYFFTYLILKDIGYNLDEDIHEQFCKKYNLKMKIRKSKQRSRYSPNNFDFS